MRIRFFNLFLFFAFIAVVISSSSCKKTTSQAQRDLEQEYLTKYVAKYLPGVTPKSSGLYFLETKAAPVDAEAVIVGDTIKVTYSGFLIEENDTVGIRKGYEFDTRDYEPFTLIVGAGTVIAGWEEGLTYMKEGSEATLVIPSMLAYSGTAQLTIPAYSPLVFNIKVQKIIHPYKWPTIQKLPKSL